MTLLPQYYLKKCKNGKKIQACGWRRVFKNLFFTWAKLIAKLTTQNANNSTIAIILDLAFWR